MASGDPLPSRAVDWRVRRLLFFTAVLAPVGVLLAARWTAAGFAVAPVAAVFFGIRCGWRTGLGVGLAVLTAVSG